MHGTLSELLLDLVQNAVTASATRIEVGWVERAGRISIDVIDTGTGMTAQIRERALSPFYTDGIAHPSRKIGLGLPFLVQTAESVGGRFWVESEVGHGTRVGLDVPADHVDLPALGDLVDCFAFVLALDVPEIEITRETDASAYRMRRSELVDALGDLSEVGALVLLREYVQSQEDDVWQR